MSFKVWSDFLDNDMVFLMMEIDCIIWISSVVFQKLIEVVVIFKQGGWWKSSFLIIRNSICELLCMVTGFILFQTTFQITFVMFEGFLCVRNQNSFFGGCPVHHDYCQVADMCILCVFMWFQAANMHSSLLGMVWNYLAHYYTHILICSHSLDT